MSLRSWSAFLLLGLIWGSSFLWIKLALVELGPFTLVGYRLLFGALGMSIVLLLRRPVFPRGRRIFSLLALMGLTNTALPFTLISWGQTSIDSGVASILNSTTPRRHWPPPSTWIPESGPWSVARFLQGVTRRPARTGSPVWNWCASPSRDASILRRTWTSPPKASSASSKTATPLPA